MAVRLVRELLAVHVVAGRVVDGQRYVPSLHSHPLWELTLIERGSGTRLVGDRVEPFHPGELVLLAPDLAHTWASTGRPPADGVRACVVHFTGQVADLAGQLPGAPDLPALLRLARHGLQWSAPPPGCLPLLQRLSEVRAAGPGDLADLFAVLGTLEGTNPRCLASDVGPPTDPAARRRLDDVRQYVLAEYASDVDAATAARLAAMTPSAFSRFFRRSMHRSFTDYVTEVRISAAAALLRDTDLAVSDIAHRVGYGNLANFNRRFRSHHQMTPREYRGRMTAVEHDPSSG